MKINIRPENKNDYSVITMINDMAFGQEAEGKLVEKLRKNRKFIKELSLVASMGNEVVGHILFFPILIKSNEKEFQSLALAPMSVIPELQSLGIGSQLVEKGLSKAKKLGHQSVIVLGHDKYYPKFGFKPASKFDITAPFEVPDQAFMAIELEKNSLDCVQGCVEYPKEFNDL
ncbi:GNAT family N-acetyltransferase [Marinifilum sp. N1E240]|uniref:GNAT family N-acetyltransferase n=1 Tax=Marinifilum sp. N1E240 TaxID=2608082 RepID=UPI00128CBD77|nr:N-acetyltransferase [Marinifilum sp. N1E240]MPQ48645.1 GNAT family N-acetyltransferase [Marinifilum sp. N1E240]